MNFAALSGLALQTAAFTFSRNAAGEPLAAWFPPDGHDAPDSVAGYTLKARDVADAPMKMRSAEALGLHLSPQTARSVSLAPLPYVPLKSRTTFLIGYALPGTDRPDPARVQRHRIAELRMGAGAWEIDAERIGNLIA